MIRSALIFFLSIAAAAPAQEPSGSFADLASRAAAAKDANDTAAAIGLYKEALHLNPHWQEGWWMASSLQYDNEQYADAAESLRRLVTLRQGAGPAWGLLGLCEYETGSYASALDDIERSLAIGIGDQPQMAGVLKFHEALLLTKKGEYDAALQKYSSFLPPVVSDPQVLLGLGLLALRRAEVPKDVRPEQTDLFSSAGQALAAFLTADYARAQTLYDRLLAQFPNDPNVRYAYGYFMLRSDPQRAIEEWQRTLSLDPSNAAAHAMLSWTYSLQDEREKALTHAREALAEDANLPVAQIVFGRVLVQKGQIDLGIEHLERAVRIAPTISRLISPSPLRTPKPDVKRTPGGSGSFVSRCSRKQAHLPSVRRLSVLLFWMAAAAAGQTKRYTCATCHVKEAASQPATPMARALLLPGQNPTLKTHNRLSFKTGKFNYLVETQADASTYTVTDGERTVSVPIRWTFGAGAQTFVLERDGGFIESLVSYYPEIGGLDITIGDNALTPQTVEEAIGRAISRSEAAACFGCHSTNAVTGNKLALGSLNAGVRCEHCHTEAPAHVNAVSHPGGGIEFKSTIPEKLGKRSAESISNFCGQCHRSWETVVRGNFKGAINVRFQPYRLANSKCFDGTDSRISCLACHNPHEDLVRDDAAYDPKCLACHASGAALHNASTMPAARSCPVEQRNCVSCHMPKVRLPGGHETFTDHQIRVVKPGEPYPD